MVKMKLTVLTILVSYPVFLSATPPQSFIDDVVQRHNELRARHQVGPVKENRYISIYAQKWADYLARTGRFEHRQRNKYGENLSWMSSSATGRQHVDFLYTKEESYYRKMGYYFSSPNMANFNHFGHFTQIVWKGSREIGVGKAGGIVVLNYHPPGNYVNQFNENVFAPSAVNDTLFYKK